MPSTRKPPSNRQPEEAGGEPPLVRPVNVGCCILKWALQVVAREPGTRQAAEGLGPIQRGLGQKRGVEACAHLSRALYIKGYTVALNDFKNGFNDFHRQAMMDAVQRECPACTNLMNYYYAADAACFCMADGRIKIIWSSQGSRMGCVLGSFGFDLTVKPIYEQMAKDFPGAVLRALTDDLIAAFPPPEAGECIFDTITRYYGRLETAALKIGLKTNIPKRAVMLPEQGPRPTEEKQRGESGGRGPCCQQHAEGKKGPALPPGTKIKGRHLGRALQQSHQEGIKVAGAPIGTTPFIRHFLAEQIDKVNGKMEASPQGTVCV